MGLDIDCVLERIRVARKDGPVVLDDAVVSRSERCRAFGEQVALERVVDQVEDEVGLPAELVLVIVMT